MKLLVAIFEEKVQDGGCGLFLDDLLMKQACLAIMPIHNYDSLDALQRKWLNLVSYPWMQPLGEFICSPTCRTFISTLSHLNIFYSFSGCEGLLRGKTRSLFCLSGLLLLRLVAYVGGSVRHVFGYVNRETSPLKNEYVSLKISVVSDGAATVIDAVLKLASHYGAVEHPVLPAFAVCMTIWSR